jgi:hypothetical protein
LFMKPLKEIERIISTLPPQQRLMLEFSYLLHQSASLKLRDFDYWDLFSKTNKNEFKFVEMVRDIFSRPGVDKMIEQLDRMPPEEVLRFVKIIIPVEESNTGMAPAKSTVAYKAQRELLEQMRFYELARRSSAVSYLIATGQIPLPSNEFRVTVWFGSRNVPKAIESNNIVKLPPLRIDAERINQYKRNYKEQTKDKATVTSTGGIDLNKINVGRKGSHITIKFDPAQLNELTQGGFEGFSPRITSITTIQNLFSFLRINT